MTVLEVGGGDDPDPRATVTTDIRPTASADAQADIYDLPLCDDAAEGLIARHVVEHLLQPELALEEVARVVEPGGWVEIRVPVGANAANDGDHEGRWTWERPEQYSRAHRRGWDPDLPLRLVDRDLNVWLMGPWSPLSPLFQLAGRRWPEWAAYRAGGGELVVRYNVTEEGPGPCRMPCCDANAVGEFESERGGTISLCQSCQTRHASKLDGGLHA